MCLRIARHSSNGHAFTQDTRQPILPRLRDEDGLIYDNIRFRPAALLAMDAPVARFLQFVNRQPPSCWSRRVEV